MRRRYVWADRPGRSQLLDEMAKVTGLERKTLIRLLHGDLARHPRQKQRGRIYGPEVDEARRVLAGSFDYLCAERLTSNLFQPVLRLQEKTFVPLEGRLSKVQRHYDQAQIPFDRLCATTAMRAERREALERLRDRTNPRRLWQEIYDLIDQIAALPCAGAVVSSTRPEGGKQLGDIII